MTPLREMFPVVLSEDGGFFEAIGAIEETFRHHDPSKGSPWIFR
jgi:hypothetical protein